MTEPPDYRREGDRLRIQYDWSSMPPSTAVVDAVAFATDRDPIELDSLHDSIDFDALDTLLDSSRPTDAGELALSFEFEDHEILLYQSGTVVVGPSDSIP